MQNKKKVILVISVLFYIAAIGFILPYMVITLDWYRFMYNEFEKLAIGGFFFFIYTMANLLVLPFIYSTLVKEKLSFNIRDNSKKVKKPKFYTLVLLIIGLPIMIWLIVGIVGYYSITEFSGGIGEFARNGFLVLFIILLYFCIFPAIILGIKRSKSRPN